MFCSDHARRILVTAYSNPRSVRELAEECETSLPTAYRRVNALVEYDLLEEDLQLDPDGNHYKTYKTALDRVQFAVESEQFTVDIDLRRDIVDQFGALWQDLETSSRSQQ